MAEKIPKTLGLTDLAGTDGTATDNTTPAARAKYRLPSNLLIARRIYPAAILIVIIIVSWFMAFLHDNVYLTMSQAEISINLRTKLVEQRLDSVKFEAVKTGLQDKLLLKNWNDAQKITSPFGYGPRYIPSTTPIMIISSTANLFNISSTTDKSTSTR